MSILVEKGYIILFFCVYNLFEIPNNVTILKVNEKLNDTNEVSIMAKVLVVDDAMFMCMTIKQILEKNGHVMVGSASNGIEAVEKFVELRPDIVILDITMPEMNGIEALRRIKIIEPKAKVIICSAIGQQEMIAQAIELGAQQFIVKPFEANQLVEAIDRLVC